MRDEERDMEEKQAEMDRLVPGSDATLENMGPSRQMPLDDETDLVTGTTSGMGLRGRPRRGDPLRGR